MPLLDFNNNRVGALEAVNKMSGEFEPEDVDTMMMISALSPLFHLVLEEIPHQKLLLLDVIGNVMMMRMRRKGRKERRGGCETR